MNHLQKKKNALHFPHKVQRNGKKWPPQEQIMLWTIHRGCMNTLKTNKWSYEFFYIINVDVHSPPNSHNSIALQEIQRLAKWTPYFWLERELFLHVMVFKHER